MRRSPSSKGVEECEADGVRFGANGKLSDEAFAGLGEPRIGVPLRLACGGVEL